MIQLTEPQWQQVLGRLRQDHPASWTLIRSRMRRELGFTVRHHDHWNSERQRVEQQIFLDFFDDRQETWFRIKYADMICPGNSTIPK